MPNYNYYPATYQSPIQMPMQYQQYPQQAYPQMPYSQMAQQNQVMPHNGIIWVSGEVGAKAYQVAPGTSAILMDSEENRFFIKSSDASGMPMPLRVFNYTEEVASQQSYDASNRNSQDYITREEFEQYIRSMKNTDTEVIVPQKSSRRGNNSAE